MNVEPAPSSTYLQAVADRVVIFDGAMGTNLQLADLTADDFGGPDLEGCNELLVVTRPDVVDRVHRSFFEVGCDVVETDTFGAFAPVLAEYGQAHRVRELNLAAASLAREAADDFSTPDRPRWVAGSIGPGTKFPTLGQIPYADLRDAYEEQSAALIEGGVDLIIIETVFDLLQAKSAINGARRAMKEAGRRLPIQGQVTIELTGTMLPGTEVGAALCALQAMDVDVIGLNCATGPSEMFEPLRHLTGHASIPVSCLPNAGLPSVVDGAMHYDLTPDQLAEYHRQFVSELGVSVIGGCCGTLPQHLAAVVEACADLTPAARHPEPEHGAASIYTQVPFDQDTSFLVVGERTNANGSKKFREAMLEADWDTCVAMAKEQVKEGSHLIDVCVDYTGADGVADMEQVTSRFATQSTVPLDGRLHRGAGGGDRPVVDRGPGRHQLGQPRGGRRAGDPARLLPHAGQGVRRRRGLHLHRHRGPGPHGRLEGALGHRHPRHRHRTLRAAARGPHVRRPGPPAVHRHGGEPQGRHRDHRGHPPDQGRAARRLYRARAVQRLVRPQPGRPPGPQLGVPPRVRGGRARRRHRARLEDPAPVEDRRPGQGGLPRPHLRPPPRRLRPADRAAVPLRGGLGVLGHHSQEDRTGWTVERRLEHRIIDGDRNGIEADLDEAMAPGTPRSSSSTTSCWPA